MTFFSLVVFCEAAQLESALALSIASLALAFSAAAAFWAATLAAWLPLAALDAAAFFLRSASRRAASTISAWILAMQAVLAFSQALSGSQTFSWYGILNAPKDKYFVCATQMGKQGFGVHGIAALVSTATSSSSSSVVSSTSSSSSPPHLFCAKWAWPIAFTAAACLASASQCAALAARYAFSALAVADAAPSYAAEAARWPDLAVW